MSAAVLPDDAVAFPSTAWFQRLADHMNAHRARQEQLGYVDCVAEFRVTGGPAVQVTFEEFAAVDVRPAEPGRADFALEASRDTWRAMIESIARGGGRPELTQTLNHLSHPGTPMRLVADDPLKADLYFRYNQSLQEFVNASAGVRTVFPDEPAA